MMDNASPCRISNPKQQKKCVAPKKAIVKKDVKSKVVAKKWLDGRLMPKTTIQVNLCCLLHVSLGQIYLNFCY